MDEVQLQTQTVVLTVTMPVELAGCYYTFVGPGESA